MFKRSTQELEREIAARQKAEHALQEANAELQRQVDALRATEERFRLLVEGTKDYAIFMLDPAGHIVSWNPGAERIKQYRTEEIVGQHFSRFYAAEDIQSGKPAMELRVAAAEGKFEDEGWRLRKDGTRFWASVIITALRDRDGNLRGFSKITRDMTQRKEAEENARRLAEERAARQAAEANARIIQEQREQLRVTLESIGDAVIVTDIAGRVNLVNPVGQQLTGWGSQEAAGQPLARVFDIKNEQTGRPVENPVARVLAEGVVVGLANHTALTARDGSVRPIEDSAAPIKDEKGRTLGVVLVFRDATEKRRIENEIREADRNKDEFLAMLAHELRNPLAPLHNALQILRMRGVDAATAERARAMMERQVQHMVRLVDDLLDVSRIMRGKIELHKEPVDVATIIARAVETAQPAIDALGHALEISLPKEPVLVEGDLMRLAQVVSNLLNNAAKYTEQRGRIWLSAERQGEELVLRVRDSGVGISPEFLPRIFDLFVQAEHGVARAQGGLGIGLTLVRRVVEMHGGRVTATSAGKGKGSEFIVRLPALSKGGAPRAGAGQEGGGETSPGPSFPCHRILVVDDSTDAADSLATLLRLQGQNVQVAYDGPAALAAAEGFRPELVFLDIGMPGMDGYEVARRLRRQPENEKTLLVALTGWGQKEDRQRSKEAGFDHHLTKPAGAQTLRELLGNLGTVAR
jgi:PAS domain S-box-containing protein